MTTGSRDKTIKQKRRSNKTLPTFVFVGVIVLIFNSLTLRPTIKLTSEYDYAEKGIIPQCDATKTSTSLSPAYEESLSFFDDITSTEWAMMKDNVQFMNNDNHLDESGDRDANWIYQQHHHPNFLCTHERRIGRKGDGGKWVCDPHRIAQKESCLVYIVGSSNGDFSFEESVKEEIGEHCEMHTFDSFGDYEHLSDNVTNYHRWGISDFNGKENNTEFKTVQQTMEDLGHTHRTVDIFKIECGWWCEWSTFPGWFSSDVVLRQILVEVHHKNGTSVNTTETERFYDRLKEEGYVTFHREANIYETFQNDRGKFIEFSFLKLDSSFFV